MTDEQNDETTTVDTTEMIDETLSGALANVPTDRLTDFHFSLSEVTVEARGKVDYSEQNEIESEADRIENLTSNAKTKLNDTQTEFDNSVASGGATDAALGKLVRALGESKQQWETLLRKSEQLNAKRDAIRKQNEAAVINNIRSAVVKAIADYKAAKAWTQQAYESKVRLAFSNAPGNLKIDDKGNANWALAYAVGLPVIAEYERQLIGLGAAARELDVAASGFGLGFNLRSEYPVFVTPDMVMKIAAGDRATITDAMPRAFAPVDLNTPLIRNNN